MRAVAHQVKLPTSIYPVNVVEKACLAWQSLCQVTIENQGDFLTVEISFGSCEREEELADPVGEFLNYVLDAAIQDHLAKQSEEV